jgi:hypothetical protein
MLSSQSLEEAYCLLMLIVYWYALGCIDAYWEVFNSLDMIAHVRAMHANAFES